MGRKAIDEVGNKYGRLLVLRMATEEEYARGTGKPIRWYCKCDCGNYTFADGRDLRNGTRVSCGCQGKEKAKELAKKLGESHRANLIGQRFSKLLVLELYQKGNDTNNDKNVTLWKCQCDCGAITYVRSDYLLSGHTTSCGCNKKWNSDIKTSKGEELISSLLNHNNILFEREKTFNDLKHGLLRFDFYLPEKNIIIEWDGLQHFEQVSYFQKTRKDFLKGQENDRRKNNYCLTNNIILYRIPYWEQNNIKKIEDIFQSKFIVTSMWHNDIIKRGV